MRQTKGTSRLTRMGLASTSDWPSTLNSPESHLPLLPPERTYRGEVALAEYPDGDGEVQKDTRGHDVNQQAGQLTGVPRGFRQRWKSITRSMM